MKLSAQVGVKTAGVLLSCLVIYLLLPVELSGSIPTVRALAFMLPFLPVLIWGPIFFGLDRGRKLAAQAIILAFALGFFMSRLGLSPVAAFARREVWGNELQSMLSIGSFSLFWGFLVVFLMFGTLRLTLESSESFTDIEDPVLLSFVTGLGFALGTNTEIALGIETLRTGPFLARVMINSFSYSTFAALVGYGVARVKFSEISGWRFILYQVAASVFAGFVYSLDNVLRLVSPLGIQVQSLANLLIMAGLSLLVVLFLTKRLKRKCTEAGNRRESITSKPALLVLLLATILTATTGFMFRQPDFIITDVYGKAIHMPQGMLAYSFDRDSRSFQIPWNGSAYQLLCIKTDGDIETAVIKYELGTLEVPPPEDFRRFDSGSRHASWIFRESFWENGLPVENVGIDRLEKTIDGSVIFRLTGKDAGELVGLYHILFGDGKVAGE